jgi:hypothetical protein
MRFHKLAPNISPVDSVDLDCIHPPPLVSPQNAHGFTYAARFLPRLRPFSHPSRPLPHLRVTKLLIRWRNSLPESELESLNKEKRCDSGATTDKVRFACDHREWCGRIAATSEDPLTLRSRSSAHFAAPVGLWNPLTRMTHVRMELGEWITQIPNDRTRGLTGVGAWRVGARVNQPARRAAPSSWIGFVCLMDARSCAWTGWSAGCPAFNLRLMWEQLSRPMF